MKGQRRGRRFAELVILTRQHQRKRAALPRHAVDADRTAQQRRQIPRDRQAKAGATVLAVGGAVRLTERLENTFLLICSDTDTGVLDAEGDVIVRLRGNGQADRAVLSELDRVGQQVLDHLLQTLTVGEQQARCVRLNLDAEGEFLVRRQRFEHRAQAVDQSIDTGVFGNHFKFAGLDLGNVENVVDQVEQIVAGRIDRFGKLDLFRRQILLRVFRQQLGQNQ